MSFTNVHFFAKSRTNAAIISNRWSLSFFISLAMESSFDGLGDSISKNSLGVIPKYSQIYRMPSKEGLDFPVSILLMYPQKMLVVNPYLY